MTPSALKQFTRFQSIYLVGMCSILDVGSGDVNGCVRSLIPKAWDYCGIDIAPGPNVDRVIPATGAWHLGEQFDAVLLQSTLEHCARPWEVFANAAAHLRSGGHLFSLTPFAFKEHRHPVDCWRLLPDGFKALCADNDLAVMETFLYREPLMQGAVWESAYRLYSSLRHQIRETQCVGIARKP
jgi:SAM-dependent methyltransferase